MNETKIYKILSKIEASNRYYTRTNSRIKKKKKIEIYKTYDIQLWKQQKKHRRE